MSIEYTIDIQLTELGFPDILQAQDTSVTQTSSHPPTARSGKRKQRLLPADDKEAKQPSVCSSAPRSETSECRGRPPAHSLQDEQAAEGAVLSDPSTTHGEEGCNGDTVLQNPAYMQQDEEEDDSDVSDDSDVYDEEEEDEEDDYEEEEEGKSNGIVDFHQTHTAVIVYGHYNTTTVADFGSWYPAHTRVTALIYSHIHVISSPET